MEKDMSKPKIVLELKKGLKVLVIAPHPDDIELGAGATVMRLIDEFEADVYYRVLSVYHEKGGGYDRLDEARHSAVRFSVVRLGFCIW